MQNNGIADQRTYRPFIDGLRGIAILMVMAVHISQFCVYDPVSSFYFPLSETFLNAGARGVQLFFIISAYTLFASSKIRFSTDEAPTLSFYIRRAFRILPYWWLITTLYMFLNGTSVVDNLPNYFMYFGFLRYRDHVEGFPMGWSIFVEETFYLFLPLLFAYITNLSRALWFLASMVVLMRVWRIVAVPLHIPRDHTFVFLFPFNQWFAFAAGIVLYYLQDARFFLVWMGSPRARILLDIATLLLLGFFLTSKLPYAVIPLMFLFMAAQVETPFFGRLARNPLLIRYGICCYSLYLCHTLLLIFLDPVKKAIFGWTGANDAPIEIRFLTWAPLFSLAALGVGLISFYFIEKPCVKMGRKVIAAIQSRIVAGKINREQAF